MELKIGIVGYGIVGRSTGQALAAKGYDVESVDKNPEKEQWQEILDADFVMVCTPEQVVPEIIEKLAEDNCKGVIVVRSTVPPGVCKKLGKKYNRVILHNPEFLRENYAFTDTLNPRFIVVGGPISAERAALCVVWMQFGPVFPMSSNESELFKLWSNAKLACNISFANEMLRIAEAYGANGQLINNLLSENPLYRNHPWQIGRAYGGRCLPKDIKQLLALYPESVLLKAVEQVNAEM